MNRHKLFAITFSLFILVLSVGIAFASDNETAGTDSTHTFTEIQTSVDEATENSVIELNGTYIGDESIKVSKSLTIQSKDSPVVLDAQNNTRIFHIYSGNLTFKNIIFTNAVSNNGGAFYSLGDLKFINCTFKNNFAEKGGAIYSKASVTVTDCIFDINFAKNDGGAICVEYSLNKNASKIKVGNINIENSIFINNNAITGGAVFASLSGNIKGYEEYGNIIIRKSQFSNNTGIEFAGGVYYGGSSYYGKAIVERCNFTHNYADQGSAIQFSNDDFTLSNCNFFENSAYIAAVYIAFDSGKIKNCNFQSNTADAVSSVLLYESDVSLIDCKFKNNSVATISSYSNSKLSLTNGKTTTTYKKVTVLDNSFKKAVTLTVKGSDLLTSFNSRDKFTVQILDKTTKAPMKYYGFYITFKSAKKVKTIYRSTDANGKFKLRIGTYLPVGTYKVTYTSDDWGIIDSTEHILKIKKGTPNIYAPKVTNKYGKSKYFKVKLTDKLNNTIYNVKIKVKVYIGKKVKTYTLENDDEYGYKINTKNLSKGSHKVVITSADSNYKFTVNSKIKIT